MPIINTSGGIVRATKALAEAGVDDSSFMTPLRTKQIIGDTDIKYLLFSLANAIVPVTVNQNIGGDFTIPFTGTILQSDTLLDQLAATTDTAGITGTMVVDIHLNGTTIMTTNKLNIETTEKGSQDAGTQPDLTTTAVTAGDIISFDIDVIHTTPAKGLKVLMAIQLTKN